MTADNSPPPRLVLFGSHWMGEGDVVARMTAALSRMADVVTYDPGLYTRLEPWVHKVGPVHEIDATFLLTVLDRHRPDAIIFCAGGLTPPADALALLRCTVTVGIALSDPDVFPEQTSRIADRFDLFYTNAVQSVADYARIGVAAGLFPFAADPEYHRPLGRAGEEPYDVVVVGHARPDRARLVRRLRRRCRVGTFGAGWPEGRVVRGAEQVAALNMGRLYLSFARTQAGFENVKVGLFEAIACRRAAIVHRGEEVERYFRFGCEVIGYVDEREVPEIVRFHLAHPEVRDWIAENGYRRLLAEHTFRHRWEGVLADIRRKIETRWGNAG